MESQILIVAVARGRTMRAGGRGGGSVAKVEAAGRVREGCATKTEG